MGLPRQGGQLDPEARASVAREAYLNAPEFSREREILKIKYDRCYEQVLRREVVCGSNACAIDACFVTLDASHVAQDKKETQEMALKKVAARAATAALGILLGAFLVDKFGLMPSTTEGEERSMPRSNPDPDPDPNPSPSPSPSPSPNPSPSPSPSPSRSTTLLLTQAAQCKANVEVLAALTKAQKKAEVLEAAEQADRAVST